MSAEPGPTPATPHWAIILLAAIGLLVLLGIIVIAVIAIGPGDRPQRARVAGAAPETEFAIGAIEDLPGTNLVHIAITNSDRARSGSYSGVRGTYNILLLDKGSGAGRRILPDNSRRIEDIRYLSAEGDHLVPGERPYGRGQEDGEEPQAPTAYYVVSVERPGPDRIQDILVGRLADGRQAYVMQGVDGIDARWMDGPTRIGFLVRERLGLYYRIVDTASLRVVQSRRVAIE